jgi:hypothetical protein
MSDENPLDFASMIAGQKAQGTKTPIEISTPAFRGVAQNFFSLPLYLFLDLKAAQHDKTGDELLILFDAAEQAFTDHDMEKLEDLTLTDFIAVMQAWVNASQQSIHE